MYIISPMTRRTRHRLRIAMLAIFCLLFQQTTLAAYLCSVDGSPVDGAAAVAGEHCTGQGVPEARDNLCAKHCHPDYSVAADGAKLSVPPLALPAVAFTPAAAQAVSRPVPRADVPIAGSDPPPRLRFCSLLI